VTDRPEFDVARQAAEVAGTLLMQYFEQGVSIEEKSASNLVSEADFEAQRVIIETIRRVFPGDEILGEEGHEADLTAERLWIVDPLDGTNNFVHGIPHFAVSIAFYRDGEPECGVVFNPAHNDLYLAQRGGGATHNGKAAHVTKADAMNKIMAAVGFYYDRGAMMEATLCVIRDLFGSGVHGIRRFGTAALDLCQTGVGMYGGYCEYVLQPWDFAAGRLFVEEAGGRVTTTRGGPIPLETTGILATNGKLHEPMLEIALRHHPK
jgi:myo-inositol-1(or 4)-monophosphatase